MLILPEVKIYVFFLLILISFGSMAFPGSILRADTPDVVQEKVNPGDDYKYIMKRFTEKIKLSISSFSSKKKMSLLSKLVEVRLSELKYVVEKKDISNFQTASQRYTAASGNASDFLLKKGSKEDKEKLIEKFNGHIPILTKLQEPYIPDNSEWRFLQDNINSLQSYISKLSE